MLPWFVLKEILSLLDRESLCRLRLVSRDFYRVAAPMLFRVHRLRKSETPKYRKFLRKYGHLFTGLVLEHNLGKADTTALATTFPRVRSVLFGKKLSSEHIDCEELANECLKLKNLRHISLYASDEILFYSLIPVVEKIDSFYTDNPLPKLGAISQEIRAKLLIPFRLVDPQDLLKFKTDAWFKEVVVVLDGVLPVISSSPASNRFYSWVQCDTPFISYFFRIAQDQFIKNKPAIERCLLTTCFTESFYFTESQTAFAELTGLPNLIDHCTVLKSQYAADDVECYHHLKDIPSLDFNLTGNIGYLQRQRETFQTTRLALATDEHESSYFFLWVIECFPNLQHLYARSKISDQVVPLKSNCFPNLVHFYSQVPQSEFFWCSLVQAAPNLRFIYTKGDVLSKLKVLNPLLQFRSYRDIWGSTAEPVYNTGFDRCLEA